MENEISEKLNTNVSFEEILEDYLYVPDYKGRAEVAKTFCNKLLNNEILKKVLGDNSENELESICDMLDENNVIKYLFDSFKDNIKVLYDIFDIVCQKKIMIFIILQI